MSDSPFGVSQENDEINFNNDNTRKTSLLNSGSFLPSVTKRTTSILCHWVSTNWANRSAQSSSAINLRECLPPMYHNAKNMAKNIKVFIITFYRLNDCLLFTIKFNTYD
jgi:hypothetical protein